LRQRLNGNEPPEFPVFAEFREQGMTDWLGMVFGFGFTLNGTWSMPVGMISSWAIDRPGGLTDAELDSLKPLVSTLALAVKGSSTLDIAQNVLRTYIGGDAAQHVLSGEIRRGSIVDLHAVLFYADLSGFTPLADATDSTTLVAWLDDYLDCMGGPVEAQGGQVLKFMGDGLLAIFPLDGAADVAATCRKALEAAAESMGRVVALNRARAAADQPTLGLDIALHVGHVAYGNVGTAERLDFTVIGPAVNEVARIENLCSSLQRPLLLSADFAQAAAASDDRLVSLGRHTLRGVREPKEIFGVETDCAELAVRSH
jgi:adenylate cyclase